MEKEFVPYELAVKLKELGFNEECFCIWNREHSLRFNNLYNPIDRNKSGKLTKNGGKYPAPLWQQAFDWFKEKYAYFTSFDYQHDENNGFFYCIINIEDEEFYFPEDFEPNIYKTYEEAREACLEKLIELCQQN